MGTHKSKKISEVINKSDEDLNLHEIKAKTGAGNGLSSTNTTPVSYTHLTTISICIKVISYCNVISIITIKGRFNPTIFTYLAKQFVNNCFSFSS